MVVCQKLFQCLQLLVILQILSSRLTFTHSTATEVGIKCIEKEREALLKFKDELIDDNGRLSSWGSEEDKKDCCVWDHVRCDNLTNHIVELGLSSAFLRGNLSVSLLDIQHLEHLDLSGNDFNFSRIPQFISSLSRLQYLDLSDSKLSGEIPHHLGNLSELQVLALSDNGYTSANLDWVSRLHSLRYLDLGYVNLSMATNWLETVNKLIQLQVLIFPECHLPMVLLPPSRFIFNSSISLQALYLSSNELTSSWIFPLLVNSNLSCLDELNLGNNKFYGPIPDAIGNLFSLSMLSIRNSHLEGKLPISLGNLTRLKYLDLEMNNLSGIVPILALSSSLKQLHLGYNNFNGTITEAHFFNLSQLVALNLSFNPGISLNFSLGWNPPFQLHHLMLSGYKVGPLFPTWLRTQKELYSLVISNAGISDTFPDWFWELSPKLEYLVVSQNNFHGALPDSSSIFSSIILIDLNYNHFNGSLPSVPFSASNVKLSDNKFSGSIAKLCFYRSSIQTQDLSNNLLSGQVSNCLANLTSLSYLNFAHNNFSGEIPSIYRSHLRSLHLQNNRFTGEIPTSLRNCTSLVFIDLSHNRLTGEIPTWIGDTWNNLSFLSLKSNGFFSSLPPNLCRFIHLQVLDLSLNNIFGGIPTCLNNITAMSQVGFDQLIWMTMSTHTIQYNPANLTCKGIEREYKTNNLQLLKLIDLSSNNLVGYVPIEITNLVALVSLNLSRNNLSGTIPSKIGQLRSLDSLDLSRNHFTGDIPTGISQLDQLGVLDLSYNNLSGKIPQSNHMQLFNDSSFEGNSRLCGLPLTKACPGDKIDRDPNTGDNVAGKKSQEDDDKFIDYGLYISIALGFIVGFWGVCGTLVLNNSWRNSFLKLSDKAKEWCYVRIEISKN